MKLGNYIEVRGHTDDISGAVAFYESLGFKKLKENVVTDGQVNIKIMPESSHQANLAYYGSDPIAIAESGIMVDHNIITTPNGVRILLMSEQSPLPVPDGNPISRLGKLGEYSCSVRSFEEVSQFWQKLGFEPVHTNTEPYPWGIFSDGLFTLGLHEHITFIGESHVPEDVAPAITYFELDMKERIKQFQSEGIDVKPATDGADPNNFDLGRFVGPGNIEFYIFTGEI